MKVYILLHCVNYEGDYIVDVYRSKEKAEKAKEELSRGKRAADSYYSVQERDTA